MMRGIIAFLLLCSAFSSRAALVTYDLREMTFSDGSRASGYLVWDSRADTYEMPEAFALELNYGTDSVYFSLDSIFSFGFSTTDLVLGNANATAAERIDLRLKTFMCYLMSSLRFQYSSTSCEATMGGSP